ncbi:MAG: hypothetical protein Q7S92_02090 [Candidatus Diapherotrites archaeon]|nr:hypothetical protein [Candidatus Diapherotrites archaeon]
MLLNDTMIARKIPRAVKHTLQDRTKTLRRTKQYVVRGLTIMPWGPKERLRSNRKSKIRPFRVGRITGVTKSAKLRALRKFKQTRKITPIVKKTIRGEIGQLEQDILELSHGAGRDSLQTRNEISKKQARLKVLKEFLG